MHSLLAHPDIVRVTRSLRERPGRAAASYEGARFAAIALVVRPADAGPELLMIKRADVEGDPWSGHIACPGGRLDPDDCDLAATAIRETLEETGIDIAREGTLIGALDDLSPRTPRLPPIIIRPFVAVVGRDVKLTANREVAAAFWIPLAAIRERASWGLGTVIVREAEEAEVPTFRHGDHTVWGLTERALRDFLHRLEGDP
ncbi:MAG: CoA pyrophosphatase [Gemmatimonadaceae bacterium]|nr:CoA pyrophosphatase [Gemmatimonadaceae bacterium]